MVRLTLTLLSGVSIAVDTSRDQAMELVELVRRSWRAEPVGVADVALSGNGGRGGDWVRLAHISAISIDPVDEEGTDDAATG